MVPIPKKVLVVANSYIVRIEVKKTLEQFGLEVLELDNAEDFFHFSGRYRDIILLILDISLPGMDGFTALEKIHTDRNWRHLPVIVLSTRADRATVARAARAGAAGYLLKPFTKEELIKRLEALLGPLISFGESGEYYTWAELETLIHNEVERAIRGGSSLSLIEITIPGEIQYSSGWKSFRQLRDFLQKRLRKIDSVFLIDKSSLLVILPSTGAEGVKIVGQKIKKELLQRGIKEILWQAVTYPNDGTNAKTLLNKLEIIGQLNKMSG